MPDDVVCLFYERTLSVSMQGVPQVPTWNRQSIYAVSNVSFRWNSFSVYGKIKCIQLREFELLCEYLIFT
jgi:hypothetical protein